MKKNWKFYALILALLITGSVAVYQRLNPQYITKTETVTVVDSTVVDSLQQLITYYEQLDPDTVTVRIPVPVPDFEDSLRVYNTNYSDSSLTASWTSKVDGILVDQTFEYYLRRQLVKEYTNTIYETKYITTTKTITRQKKPNAYLSAGIDLTLIGDVPTFSPMGTYTMSDGQTFGVKYDLVNKGISVMYTRPIRFRLPF